VNHIGGPNALQNEQNTFFVFFLILEILPHFKDEASEPLGQGE